MSNAFCDPFSTADTSSRRDAFADHALDAKMRGLPRLVALAILSLSLAGCATTERLFTSDPGPEVAAGEAARPVNLWPLYYGHGTSNTALWPLIDWDHNGFAVRPLVAKQGDLLEIPLLLFFKNTKTGNWVCTLAYRNGDTSGIFPIYTRSDEFNNIGVAWWTKGDEGEIEQSGLFPIAHFSDELSYALNAFWIKNEAGEVEQAGLFPVASLSDDFSYIGPAFWNRNESGDLESAGLFPVAFAGSKFGYVGPLWWDKDEAGALERGGLFPLANFSPEFNNVGLAFWSKNDNGEIEESGLLPIAYMGPDFNYIGPAWWLDDENGDLEYGGLFPIATLTPVFNHAGPVFWTRYENGDVNHAGLFPLAYVGPDLSYAGPVWWTKNDAGEVDAAGALPLAYFGEHFNHVGPLFWNKDDAGELEFGGLFPLSYMGTDFGYAGPVWWSRDTEGNVDRGGVFPLATVTPGLSYVGPWYWNKDATGERVNSGLLPLAYFGESFHHVGPVFWNTAEDGTVASSGLFPLAWFGEELSYAGPLWWSSTPDPDGGPAHESVGLFPLAKIGDGLNHVGPLWWHEARNAAGQSEVGSYGLFPLAQLREDGGFAANVIWSNGEDGSLEDLHVVPLFSYESHPLGGSRFLTLLGGRGVDEAGETTFFNVLGPVYHYRKTMAGYSTSALWPLFSMSEEPTSSKWHLWPLVGRSTTRNEEGEVLECDTTALAGFYQHSGVDKTDRVGLLPFFSYRSPDGGNQEFADMLSLVAYKESENGADVHVGTPLLFDYESDVDGCSWHALLGALDFESDDEGSEFNLGYYLYRQKTVGEETHVNAFPFINYDEYEDRSQVSFLWRVFNYERKGDKVGGHILFIPWGD